MVYWLGSECEFELYSSTYPVGGGLPSETTTPTYTTGLDLPSGLGSTLDGYGQGTTYTAFGQVEQDEIGNGTAADTGYVTDTYDLHTDLLTNQLVTRSSVTPADVDDVAYGYDADGPTTSETDTRLGSTSTAETQCYAYTGQGQLAQAWTATDDCVATPSSTSHSTVGDPLSADSAYDESWTYNSAGDQASETSYSVATGPQPGSADRSRQRDEQNRQQLRLRCLGQSAA